MYFMAIAVVLDFALVAHSSIVYNEELCDGERFEAKCGDHQVVLMQGALYGRMRLGRCVRVDLGHLGCHSDVLPVLDSLCTGRQRCEISNINRGIFPPVNCYSEYQVYLEVAYRCIAAQTIQPNCESNRHVVPLKHREAILTSQQLNSISCSSHPVRQLTLLASPGQHINLTLIDLQTGVTTSAYRCDKYGRVRDSVTRQQTVICGGQGRGKSIMISNSNSVELTLVETLDKAFLLKYEVLGCADPVSPERGWVRREGEKAVMGCHTSSQTWELYCQDSSWIGGIESCLHVPGPSQHTEGLFDLIPKEVLLTLIVAVGAIFCVTTVTCILVCWKRSMVRSQKYQLQSTQCKPKLVIQAPCPEAEFMLPHHRVRRMDTSQEGIYDFCITPGPYTPGSQTNRIPAGYPERTSTMSSFKGTLPATPNSTNPTTRSIVASASTGSMHSARSDSRDTSLDNPLSMTATLPCRSTEGDYGRLGATEEEPQSPQYKSLVFFND